MAAVTITPDDLLALQPALNAEVLATLITGTMARAAQLAPCILAEDFPYPDAAKAIVVDVILRRVDLGTGVIQAEASGPNSRTFFAPPPSRSLFWPAEIAELQGLCLSASSPGGSGLPAYDMPPADRDLFPARCWPSAS